MPQIYQLKITLFERNIQPPIWRRVTINGEKTLFDLHYVIQGAMGWQCSHLYAFYHPDSANKYPDRRNDGYADLRLMGGELDYKDDKLFKIKDFFKNIGDLMFYEYDFGDSWEHSIRLEAITETTKDSKPACIDGARNCPPENCGSLPGYLELIDSVKNPRSQRARELREWYGETYKPEEFNLKKANYDIEYGRAITEANIIRDTMFNGNAGSSGMDISAFLNSMFSSNQAFQKQMNRSSASGKILVLKISVQGIKPEISRTIEVESKLKFRELMKIIRASFGWVNANTEMGYYFIIDGKKFGKLSLFNGWYSPAMQKKIPSSMYDDSTIKLSEVFTSEEIAVNSNMPLFAWKFRIKCEAIKDKNKQQTYPICVAGRGNLTAIPSNFREIEQYLTFLTKPSDIPESADLESINEFLASFRKTK
jgi:hypothetical protein